MQGKYTSFEYGFNTKGKRNNDVGEDVISIFSSPDSWTTRYAGTPVNISTTTEGEIELTADGEKPEYLLYTRVDDKLTDMEWMTGAVLRDEREAGMKVDIYPFKTNAIIRTKLFADGYTPSAGDDLYVASGKFQKTDPQGGSGTIVGEVKSVDGDYARVVLK